MTIAWRIEMGRYGDTELDGLNFVATFHLPGYVMTGPKWNAALYRDSSTNAPQAEALGRIFSGRAGGSLAIFAEKVGWMPSLVSRATGILLASAGAVFAHQSLTMM